MHGHMNVEYLVLFVSRAWVYVTWKCGLIYYNTGRKLKETKQKENIFILFILSPCMLLHSILLPTLCTYLINPLNPELNPICCLLALLGAHHFLHVSREGLNH